MMTLIQFPLSSLFPFLGIVAARDLYGHSVQLGNACISAFNFTLNCHILGSGLMLVELGCI